MPPWSLNWEPAGKTRLGAWFQTGWVCSAEVHGFPTPPTTPTPTLHTPKNLNIKPSWPCRPVNRDWQHHWTPSAGERCPSLCCFSDCRTRLKLLALLHHQGGITLWVEQRQRPWALMLLGNTQPCPTCRHNAAMACCSTPQTTPARSNGKAEAAHSRSLTPVSMPRPRPPPSTDARRHARMRACASRPASQPACAPAHSCFKNIPPDGKANQPRTASLIHMPLPATALHCRYELRRCMQSLPDFTTFLTCCASFEEDVSPRVLLSA